MDVKINRLKKEKSFQALVQRTDKGQPKVLGSFASAEEAALAVARLRKAAGIVALTPEEAFNLAQAQGLTVTAYSTAQEAAAALDIAKRASGVRSSSFEPGAYYA
mmetsp:Transcript_67731/g.134368  ORF Transcript_67731/g.134368 Transcript_67731/m.134368 type:complete len:105 (-) Transcript_67731:116-430(-)